MRASYDQTPLSRSRLMRCNVVYTSLLFPSWRQRTSQVSKPIFLSTCCRPITSIYLYTRDPMRWRFMAFWRWWHCFAAFRLIPISSSFDFSPSSLETRYMYPAGSFSYPLVETNMIGRKQYLSSEGQRENIIAVIDLFMLGSRLFLCNFEFRGRATKGDLGYSACCCSGW